MTGQRALRDYSRPRSCSGNQAMGSCKMQGNVDNVVIIDIDSDGFDNVIIVDVPESLQQKLKVSSVLRENKNFPGIISIDDEETDSVDDPEHNVKNDGGFDSGDTPSKNRSTFINIQKTNYADVDECWIGLEKEPPFKLSKCKNTYAKKSPSRNHYGLTSKSESDSSESSSSDCEVMEGSFSELRELWEKASLKRKSNLSAKGQSGLEDQASLSSSYNDTHPKMRVENRNKESTEPHFCSTSSNVNCPEVNSSNSTATGNGFEDVASDPWMEYPFAKSDSESFSLWWKPLSKKNIGSYRKSDAHSRRETCMEDHDFCDDEHHSVNGYVTSFQNEKKGPCRPSCSIHEEGNKQGHEKRSFQNGEQRITGQHSFPNSQLKPNKGCSVQDEDASLCKDQFLGEMCSVNHSRVVSVKKDRKFTPAMPSSHTSEAERKSVGSKGKDKLVSGPSYSAEGEYPLDDTISNIPIYDGKNSLNVPFVSVIPSVQRDIINEREKLKETDEYKRAVEEEWAARQRQLQIQAEEAQRLRKRRKAESLRILDMEKRQKQRLQEVRETQRKDEENLNMKDNLRAEVRKELCKLENTCIDMASLLRGLGIHVEGGFHPLSQEVHSAYKRALLKFHPDRASRTDIRQQVEAEEKFKLISRMKEKFLFTSCH